MRYRLGMYGKIFASLFTGSMYGRPPLVFAVWSYAIAHMRPRRSDGECYVEVNPALLSGVFASTADEVLAALAELESPDPASRTPEDGGARLVLVGEWRGPGPMQYRVVNGARYRAIRDEEERRAYLTEAKRASRKRSTMSTMSTAVNRRQPPSTQVEVEVEAEVEAEADTQQGVQGGTPPSDPHTRAPRKRPRATAADGTDEETATADRVIARISDSVRSLVPSARGFEAVGSNRVQIFRRLREGVTEADLIAVVDARAAACRKDISQVQWLTPITPFRDANWARSLAEVYAAAGARTAGLTAPAWALEPRQDEEAGA